MPRAVDVQRMFSSIVSRYDILNRLLSLGLDRGWRRALVKSLGENIGGGKNLGLDLCCGTGDVAVAICRAGKNPGLLVTADFSFPMCRSASTKLQQTIPPTPPPPSPSSAKALTTTCADGLRLPFRTAAFDFVSVAFGVRNFESLEQGLAEIARVTRPGGQLAILEFAPPDGFFLRFLYRPYLRIVPPLLGRILAGATPAYSYLGSSIESFLRPSAMLEAFVKAGFHTPLAKNLSFGITYLYIARR